LAEGHLLFVEFLKEGVECYDIVEHLDDPAVGCQGNDFIGEDNTVYFFFLESLLKSIDELHCKLF
jgi:hypothetical protein